MIRVTKTLVASIRAFVCNESNRSHLAMVENAADKSETTARGTKSFRTATCTITLVKYKYPFKESKVWGAI